MAKQKIERTELLTKTIILLRDKGYYSTSMADIAEACLMSKAGLYHYFDSKLELVAAALHWVKENFIVKVLSLADDLNKKPRDRFSGLLSAIEPYLLGRLHDGTGCLMANISLETSGHIPEFVEVIKAFFDAWISTYQTLLGAVFTEKDAKALAESAVAQTQGALLLTQIYGDSTHLLRVHRGLLQCWDRQELLNAQTQQEGFASFEKGSSPPTLKLRRAAPFFQRG
ncbi:MAG: transcriptional regulator, TetR/AcrR family [Gammaproteobacteria bacterium]|jgi:TetR/AcrR family transcriptional repressor of nem operon|nr:transcriptional regulator, TetR/AcrR family [Gammaproteobacteria bacterium]